MKFVYPYIRTRDDYDIRRSILWIWNNFPDSEVITVGDAVDGCQNIPHKKRYIERGCDVTDKLLTFAMEIGGDAVYMNDDFFVSENWDPKINIRNGILKIDSKHAPNYQSACKNTLEFLSHYQYSCYNFECHQPIFFNSCKLLELFDNITWQNHNHFLKSLYLNVYPTEMIDGENLKIGRPDINKANLFIQKYGCFSISDDFKNQSGSEFLNRY